MKCFRHNEDDRSIKSKTTLKRREIRHLLSGFCLKVVQYRVWEVSFDLSKVRGRSRSVTLRK